MDKQQETQQAEITIKTISIGGFHGQPTHTQETCFDCYSRSDVVLLSQLILAADYDCSGFEDLNTISGGCVTKLYTSLSFKEYINFGSEFESQLFPNMVEADKARVEKEQKLKEKNEAYEAEVKRRNTPVVTKLIGDDFRNKLVIYEQ
ncbi:hypothetical protein N9Z70_03650 [Mariniblastus sp.]|nr:hypothetical protein [Mariniblastus sp.]